jgi:hypothetical protein
MVIILYQAPLAVSKNNKSVTTVPKYATIPTTLAEDTPSSINAAPG